MELHQNFVLKMPVLLFLR